MNHTPVTTHRELALVALDSALAYDDLRKSLEERRTNEPDKAGQLGRMIGEANGALGVALKVADVHATLAVVDALAKLSSCGHEQAGAGTVEGAPDVPPAPQGGTSEWGTTP